MRILAIDFGQRRVGLALSDEGGTLASPLDVLTVASADHAADLVAQVAAREAPQRLLVGVPINMDGSWGAAARQTVAWGSRLGEKCGLPVIFVDERLSSFAAEQQLSWRRRGGQRLTRGGKRRRLDAVAAAAFLQEYLDGALRELSVAEISGDEP
jgi:putative Holliday junction resolvase